MSEVQVKPKAIEIVPARDMAPEGRTKYRALTPAEMPRDFSISLDAYRRGGTDAYLGRAPDHAVRHSMQGFEPTYVNIVDYIIRITHRIWEEKDIGYIYDTYAQDCMVYDDFGLGSGRERVVEHTVRSLNGFPDTRVIADECIWAGSDATAFHSSHRSQIFGTNTGYSQYGEPTGKKVQFWCIANCVMKDNEIFYEHVVYDFVSLIQQLGHDVVATAKRLANTEDGLPRDFLASEPQRAKGQAKPERLPIAADIGDNPEQFVRAALHNIWNRRDFSLMERVYAPAIQMQGTGGRHYHGVGQLRSFMLSQAAMFPDMLYSIDDLYWMGNAKDGFVVAIRWSMDGTHRGYGRYGAPTGREVNVWGVTHWVIENNQVTKEWTVFNEFGVLMQIHR